MIILCLCVRKTLINARYNYIIILLKQTTQRNQKMSMKPSELLTKACETSALPFYGSVFADVNYEAVFINALMICNRTGDEWGLSIETYTAEREKAGNFSTMEKRIAEKVPPYVADYTLAVSFSEHGIKIHSQI